MLFTCLLALATGHGMAMRPALVRAVTNRRSATARDALSEISSLSDSRAALQAAAGIVDGVLAETGNATEHMSDGDEALLREVIDLVNASIYGSMDSAHAADEAALAAGLRAVEECNADIAARQSLKGDLGKLHKSVSDDQNELDRLQGVVDQETSDNASAWDTFDTHMQMIGAPPACPDFPTRTMSALDVYFEKSEYSVWFASQGSAYADARALYVAADAALTAAIADYNIQKAVRDTQYCDWKWELDAACADFDACFAEKSDDFNKRLVPRVQSDMDARIDIYKAGETLIHQIKFLLADVKEQETPAIATSRYELDFPVLPPKGICDLSVLDDEKWLPPVKCSDSKVLFKESFETMAVTSADGETMCRSGGVCGINAWVLTTHPSYLKLVSEKGSDWKSPFGTQALKVFGYQRCPNKQPCGAITGDAVLKEIITEGAEYTLTVNVAAFLGLGDYQIELASVDDSADTRINKRGHITLASTSGTTASKDFSTTATVSYVATANAAGKRLAIRLLDNDQGHWKETPMFDNVILTKSS